VDTGLLAAETYRYAETLLPSCSSLNPSGGAAGAKARTSHGSAHDALGDRPDSKTMDLYLRMRKVEPLDRMFEQPFRCTGWARG